MIYKARMTAELEGDFVVFLIGMRINRPWLIHKWLPVAMAMPRMIRELKGHPEMGFLHAHMWFSRTILVLQYWRSIDHLLAYASDRKSEHFPAWRAFNESVGTDGSVGIWHETYLVRDGNYESVYVNMPTFGLGKAGVLKEATAGRRTARERLKKCSDECGADAPAESWSL